MLDKMAVPRRPFDFADYLDMARRNFRWIIAPTFAGIVIATVIAFLAEDTYVSKAMLRIVPQQVSPDLVRVINTQDITARVQGMAQTILSRGTLANLITTYGLYKDELRREPMEDVFTRMRAAIKIVPVAPVGTMQTDRSIPAMQVEFSYRDRMLAMKVCSDLVSQFLTVSSVGQTNGAREAEVFFADQMESAKRTLNAADQKLEEYKAKHLGSLPDEMSATMGSMAALQQRLGSLTDTQTRNSEQRLMLETQLNTARTRLNAVKSNTPTDVVRNQKALRIEKEIEDLQSQIDSLRKRYTEDYPDIQVAKDRLVVLTREREDFTKSSASVAGSTRQDSVSTPERIDAQGQVDAVLGALSALKVAEAATSRDIADVNNQLHAFEARLYQAPAGEKEYLELQRDREMAKGTFEKAQERLQLAQAAVNLDANKQGEALELIDAASTPTSPTAPNRALYIPLGFAAGLLVGLILVAIREVRDTSLKSLKDARLYTQLSILGSVPLLENDVVVQRRKQVMWVSWATATILGIAMMGASVAHYYLSKT